MKRFILLVMMLLPMSAMASIPEVQKLAESFTDANKASSAYISKQMLRMLGDENAAGMEYVDNVVILTSNSKSAAKAINKRTQRIAKKRALENLATLKKNNATTYIYTISANDRVTEALVLIAEKKKSVLVNISGSIPQEFVASFLNTGQF